MQMTIMQAKRMLCISLRQGHWAGSIPEEQVAKHKQDMPVVAS